MQEQGEENYEKESRFFLIELANKAGEEFLRNNPTLDRIESGEMDRESWRSFAIQRHLAALPFEDLLKACKESAEKIGDAPLARAIERNLQDERGIDAAGELHPELSHGTWRVDFYTALGITEEQLYSTPPSEGTREYESGLRELIATGDFLIIAGALLVLEGTIPREFARMKKGRDVTFKKEFDDANDGPEERERKRKARLYLDDHIVHDARSHYPDLLNALERHARNKDERARIQKGADAIVRAKKSFYNL